MSTFLGPIHYWLFDKIKLVEDREKELASAFRKSLGDEAASIIEEVGAKFPPYLNDTPLDELIGDSGIHDYLEKTIRIVETRESALISALIERFGEKAKGLALDVSYDHGLVNGRKARKEYDVEEPSTETVNRLLKNYFLDGMPCDHVVELVASSKNEILEKHIKCLHRKSWRETGAPETFMCEYLSRWIDGFMDGLGPYTHTRRKSIVMGDPCCEHIYRTGKR